MSPKISEVIKFNPKIEELDPDGIAQAVTQTAVSDRPEQGRFEYRDLSYDNFNLLIKNDDGEIGKASINSWVDQIGDAPFLVATIEDLHIYDSSNNHSAYLAVVEQAASSHPGVSRIEGLPLNDMSAVMLDLDTLGLLPEGWAVRYFREEGSELVELQYPLEIFDNIKDGEPVYHVLDRVTLD